jgi:hypothetical protein
MDAVYSTSNEYGIGLMRNIFLLSYSVSSQSAGSEMKPLTEDRGGDNVVLGRSYGTTHGVVTDEYGAMVE